MNLIKEKLHVKKKTQGWLAQRTKISLRHIRRIVSNQVDPKLSFAFKIVRALNSTIEEVFIYPDED